MPEYCENNRFISSEEFHFCINQTIKGLHAKFNNNFYLFRSFKATPIEERKKVSLRHNKPNVKEFFLKRPLPAQECEDPTQKLSEDR